MSKRPADTNVDYKAAFEAINLPLLILDTEFNMVGATRTREAVTGVTLKEIFGLNHFDVFPDNPNDPNADGAANLKASLNRVLQTKQPHKMEIQKYDIPIPGAKSGEFEERFWSPMNYPILNSEGAVTHILHHVDDVTEHVLTLRRESEISEELKESQEVQKISSESEAVAREIANSVPVMIWTARPDGLVDWYNDWWYNYFGTDRNIVWDDPDKQPMHPDDVPRTHELWDKARAARETFNMEQRFRRGSDGQYRWHLVRGVPVFDSNGELLKYVGGNTDIHDEKMLAEELKTARIVAERANETKTAFLANMSHEIRTPLGAIVGFSKLLRERSLKESEKDQYVDTIVRNGNALTRIIDDILDLAKVEAGKLETEEVPFSLYQLVTDVADLFKDKTQDKQIFLLLNIDESVPMRICSDPTRLRQILVNLVGNAVKFTDKGGVRVSVRAKPGSDAQHLITIDVKDTGIGLEPAQRDKLFQPFTQADNSMTRKFGGTGLGLVLSQRLSHALHGSISIVECEVGAGCTFRLSFNAKLPAENALDQEHATSENAAESVSLRGMRILVVDDSPDNLFLVKRVLVKNGAEVDTAQDGEEGVRKALADSYDAVLMDIQMPRMDGYQAKLALDQARYTKPVVALTAHAMSDERVKTKAAGFVGHLTKPLIVADLLSTVAGTRSSGRI